MRGDGRHINGAVVGIARIEDADDFHFHAIAFGGGFAGFPGTSVRIVVRTDGDRLVERNAVTDVHAQFRGERAADHRLLAVVFRPGSVDFPP